MPINCKYNMRVAGKTEVVDAVIAYVKSHSYSNFRIYDEFFSTTVENQSAYEKKDVYITGDVKQSVLGAWNMHKYNSCVIPDGASESIKNYIKNSEKSRLEKDSILDIKGVDIEIYSVHVDECEMEPENGFAEHYILKDGKIVLDDIRTYSEHTIYNGGYAECLLDFDETKEIPTYNQYIK